MPTLQQAEIIHRDIQAVNDNPLYFPEAQAKLDAMAASLVLPNGESNAWQAYRMSRLICTNTLSHLTAMTGIELGDTGSDNSIPGEISAYDAYANIVVASDRAAVQKTYKDLQGDHPFSPVYEHFSMQLDGFAAIITQNADQVRKQGKVAKPSDLGDFKTRGEKTFDNQFTSNATSTSMSIVARSAMHLAFKYGALPEPEEITRLTFQGPGWDKLLFEATLNSQVRSHYAEGPESATRWYKDNKRSTEGRPLTPKSDWNEMLQEYVEVGALSVLAKDIGRHLISHDGELPNRETWGHCGAAVLLRPYEPERNTAKRDQAEAFFANGGVVLENGRFNAVGCQLMRGFKTAERTLYADPTYRDAMLEIVTNIRQAVGR